MISGQTLGVIQLARKIVSERRRNNDSSSGCVDTAFRFRKTHLSKSVHGTWSRFRRGAAAAGDAGSASCTFVLARTSTLPDDLQDYFRSVGKHYAASVSPGGDLVLRIFPVVSRNRKMFVIVAE
jgi:hypothetical protein